MKTKRKANRERNGVKKEILRTDIRKTKQSRGKPLVYARLDSKICSSFFGAHTEHLFIEILLSNI